MNERSTKNFARCGESYATAGAEVLAAARNQDFATGRELFTNKLIKIGEQNDEMLGKEADLNKIGGEAAVRRGNDLYDFATKFVMGGIALAALLGLIIASLLIRDVSRGITSHHRTDARAGSGRSHRSDCAERRQNRDRPDGRRPAGVQGRSVGKKGLGRGSCRVASDKIARAERVDNATRDFEAAIGELIESLSLSSTELDSAANILTTIANSTGRISSEAAISSQKCPATSNPSQLQLKEITSSVREIGRRVDEASRISGDTVQQAGVGTPPTREDGRVAGGRHVRSNSNVAFS